MVLVLGMQLGSRGETIEFVSFTEICTRSALVEELQVLQSKNTNTVNTIFIIASDVPSMNVTNYEPSINKWLLDYIIKYFKFEIFGSL
jgi:hypothetical protein